MILNILISPKMPEWHEPDSEFLDGLFFCLSHSRAEIAVWLHGKMSKGAKCNTKIPFYVFYFLSCNFDTINYCTFNVFYNEPCSLLSNWISLCFVCCSEICFSWHTTSSKLHFVTLKSNVKMEIYLFTDNPTHSFEFWSKEMFQVLYF